MKRVVLSALALLTLPTPEKTKGGVRGGKSGEPDNTKV
jgi:hypothetical protein